MQFGRYTVRGTLGRGGWAVVYLAWDAKLEREVALKAAAPEILPVIIEGPPVVSPPELAHLHFNDRLLYFMER